MPKQKTTAAKMGEWFADEDVYPLHLQVAALLHMEGVTEETLHTRFGGYADPMAKHHAKEVRRLGGGAHSGGETHFINVQNSLRDIGRGFVRLTPRLRAIAIQLREQDGIARQFSDKEKGWDEIARLVKKGGTDMKIAQPVIDKLRENLESIEGVDCPMPLYMHEDEQSYADDILARLRHDRKQQCATQIQRGKSKGSKTRRGSSTSSDAPAPIAGRKSASTRRRG